MPYAILRKPCSHYPNLPLGGINTTPVVVPRFEGDTEEDVERIKEEFRHERLDPESRRCVRGDRSGRRLLRESPVSNILVVT